MEQNQEHSSIGPLIGIIIIIIVLIAGALYFWNNQNDKQAANTPPIEINTNEPLNSDAYMSAELKLVTSQSTSSEVDDIKKDLDDTTFENLNVEE